MGKGIALQFRKAYPDNYEAYRKACGAGTVQPGRMFIFDRHTPALPRYIINFPTKRDWQSHSQIADIETGLEALVKDVLRWAFVLLRYQHSAVATAVYDGTMCCNESERLSSLRRRCAGSCLNRWPEWL